MQVDVDNSRTSIVVFGAAGRMGSRIAHLAASDHRFHLLARVTRDGATPSPSLTPSESSRAAPLPPLQTPQNAAKNTHSAHVVIDFSSDSGVPDSIVLARSLKSALLVGTTALSDTSLRALRDESSRRAVLVAPNTSLGVAVLANLARSACSALGPDYHCSIVEAHHIAKKDAPSGTAIRLAQAVRSTGHTLRDDQILAIRAGDIVGEHTIRLAGPGEYLELTHRATTRDLFARGALHTAAWLRGKPAGWYTMQDVLGLPE